MSATVLRELVAKLGLTVDEAAFKKADAGLAKVKKGLEDVSATGRDTRGRFVRGARDQAQATEQHVTKQATAVRRAATRGPSAADTFERYLGGAAVFAGLKAMTDMASAANETENVLRELFGQPGVDQIKEWSDATSVTLNRSKYQLRESAGTFGALLTPVTKDTDAVRAMSESLAVLGIDLASFYNTTDEEAMLALRSALIGQSEPLLKYAINVQDATLKEYAKTHAIHKSIEKMTQAEKTLLRYKVILEQSTKATGDATRTAGEYANVLRGLQARVKELATELGKRLLPGLKAFYAWTGDMLGALGRLTDTSNIFQGAMAALGLVILQTFGGKLWALTAFGLKLGIISAVFDEIIGFAQGNDSLIGRFLDAVGGKGTSTKWLEAISRALRDMKRDFLALIEAFRTAPWAETWDNFANKVKLLDTALHNVSVNAKRFILRKGPNDLLPGENRDKSGYRTYADQDMEEAEAAAAEAADAAGNRAHFDRAEAKRLRREANDTWGKLAAPAPGDPDLQMNLAGEQVSAPVDSGPNMSVTTGDMIFNMSLPQNANPDDYRRAVQRSADIERRQTHDAIRHAAGKVKR